MAAKKEDTEYSDNEDIDIEGVEEFCSEDCDKNPKQKFKEANTSYPSNFCGKTLTKIISRKSHELIQTGEKPYSCRYCEKHLGMKKTGKYMN